MELTLRRLTPQLREFALECQRAYCLDKNARLHIAAAAYVDRAIAQYREQRAALLEPPAKRRIETSLKSIIRDLVDAHERELVKLLERTDPEDATKKVLGYTYSKYRTTQIHGIPLGEFLQDAWLILYSRSRHMPVERGVSVVQFLCMTVRSLIDHELKGAA